MNYNFEIDLYKQKIISMYLKEKKSIRDISNIFNVSNHVISRRLIRWNIPKRCRVEALILKKDDSIRCRKIRESKKGKNNPMFGKKFSEEHKIKISESMKGKTRSPETKRKMRLSAIKRIERNKFNGNQLTPCYNSDSILIIEDYGKENGYNFQHAENGGEICIDGFFPDGVDLAKKIIIELDEKHHFNADGNLKQKDIDRQKYLESLGYEFIRIKI